MAQPARLLPAVLPPAHASRLKVLDFALGTQRCLPWLARTTFLTFGPWVPLGNLVPSQLQALALSEATPSLLLPSFCFLSIIPASV